MYICIKCFDIKEFFRNFIFIKNFSYCKNLIEKYNNYLIIKWNYYILSEGKFLLWYCFVLYNLYFVRKKVRVWKKLFFNMVVLIRDLNLLYM